MQPNVYVPRPSKPPAKGPPLTHAFDSNGVRELGRIDEPAWKSFKAAWDRKGYTTAWIPWVSREVAGTNFIRDDGIIVLQDELDQIVLAVQRFDELAKGEVFADFESMYRYSLFEYAGDPRGTEFIEDNDDIYLKRIFLAKQVKERLDIGKDGSYTNGSFWLGIKDPAGGWFGEMVTRTFVGHSDKAIAAWKTLMTVDENSPDEQVAKDISRQLLKIALGRANEMGIPLDVLQKVLDQWNAANEHPDSFFTYANILESWYYIEFARGTLTRKRRENDGHDFHIASYLTRAEHFVTGDKDLRALLRRITREPDRKLIKPAHFIKQVIS